jgi:hypothetical protein
MAPIKNITWHVNVTFKIYFTSTPTMHNHNCWHTMPHTFFMVWQKNLKESFFIFIVEELVTVYVTTPHKRKCFQSVSVQTHVAYINVSTTCTLMKTKNFLNASYTQALQFLDMAHMYWESVQTLLSELQILWMQCLSNPVIFICLLSQYGHCMYKKLLGFDHTHTQHHHLL